MRKVVVPCPDFENLAGARAVIPVKVDWPELRLTEQQMLENAFAVAHGHEPVWYDASIFEVIIERPTA